MKKEVLLFTSGLDSYIAREYLIDQGHDIDCLYFDHGGRYTKHEIEKIKSLEFPVKISKKIDLADLEADDAHIPNRNILFTTLANAMGYDKVWLGGSLSDRVGDNQPEVYKEYSKLLTTVNDKMCVINSPFYGCYKDDMVRWFVEKKPAHRTNLVTDTFSCFNPHDGVCLENVLIQGIPGKYRTKECLNCSACFRKCAVLYSGDIYIHFRNREIIDQYEKQFSKPLVHTARTLGTMAYIEQWWRYE